jgi:pimeloyl-ACP methyl ester carboxylesterase
MTAVVASVLAVVLGGVAAEYCLPRAAARGWLALTRAVGGMRERRAALGGLTIPYLEGGAGEPLVLVHGFGGDKDNYSRIAGYLTPKFRVLAPDLPGFGAAPREPSADYRIAAQVQHLRSFVAALGLGRVHLGGNSMGGFIVSEYAARFPSEVASLWLLDPAGTSAALDTPMLRTYLDTGEIPLLVRDEQAFRHLLAATMHRKPWIPASLRRVLAQRAAADFDLHARIFRQVRIDSPLLEPLLPSITAPTLIVWGAHDRVLNPAAAASLQSAIARSIVEIMPDVGHLPMLECPRACARRYLEFRAALPVDQPSV